MSRPRLLDLFCKAGGAAVGYWRAGFDVIGVDIEPQPRYPFQFWRGDALEILATVKRGDFDVIHASPPCQAFTAMKTMPTAKAHVDLLTPTRGLLMATSTPYVIENVPGAPMRRDLVLCGTMFGLGVGGADLRRHRLFELGNFRLTELCPCCSHRSGGYRVVGVYGGRGQGGLSRARRAKVVSVTGHAGGSSVRDGVAMFNTAQRAMAMGIDWMKDWELTQAIPPAYTEFIGRQLLRHVAAERAA